MTDQESTIIKYSASSTEVPALRKLCRRWAEVDGYHNFDTVIQSLSHPSYEMVYAPDLSAVGKWAGAMLYQVKVDHIDIHYLFVDPDLRRRGLAKQMMTKLIELAKVHPAIKGSKTRIVLEVRPQNTSAIKLYESFGFNIVDQRKNYYKNGDDALLMGLELDHVGAS